MLAAEKVELGPNDPTNHVSPRIANATLIEDQPRLSLAIENPFGHPEHGRATSQLDVKKASQEIV
jgi:hypothetical protein